MSQKLCLSEEQLICQQHVKVDFNDCSSKCEGLDIISYNKEETDSEIARQLLLSFAQLKRKFDYVKNPALMRKISKLSDQYNRYKETYKFPSKVKGKQ